MTSNPSRWSHESAAWRPRIGAPDREAFHAWGALLFAPSTGDAIAKDEENFLERSRTRAYVVEERVTTSG